MAPGIPQDIQGLRDRIAAVAPDLADAPFTIHGGGWDSVALDVADIWIFKFPRRADLIASLRREHRILTLVRPRVSMRVPDIVLHEDAAGVFSQHRKIPGSALLPEHFPSLDAEQRRALAEALARLHAEMHAIPMDLGLAAGAKPVFTILPMDAIRAALANRPRIAPYVLEITVRYETLPPDHTIFGQFDGHGWNMAFDHERGVLNGMFDFGDSGLGPVHRDLGYSSWVHPSLARAVTRAYAAITGYAADPETAVLHNAVLRLHEHAEGTLDMVSDDADRDLVAFFRSLDEAAC
jgi:aminoglycoside phosphotransferase (APT) family kinase protein